MQGEPIVGPTAWKAADFPSKTSFTLTLDEQERVATAVLLAKLAAARLPERAISAAHMRSPAIEQLVGRIRNELTDGRGFLVLGGLPLAGHDADTIGNFFLGLGLLMGKPVVQSPLGDRLGHVVDISKPGALERGYKSGVELSAHTDCDDVVAMLCLSQARKGGLTRLVSAHSLYNALLERAPRHLPALYRGFAHHWFGEETPGDPPITAYRVPVLSWEQGVLSVCHLRERCDMAAEADPRLAYEPAERAALDEFDRLAADPEFALEFRLEPGEAYFLNNYVLLHARTGFADGVGVAGRRHLLRLWLKLPNARPVAEPVLRYYGADGIAVRPERTSTAYQGSDALESVRAI